VVIGLFVNPKIENIAFLNDIVSFLNKKNHKVLVSKELGIKDDIEILENEDIIKQAEIIISVGGDGTFLKTARIIGESEKPIVGVHLGGLGFLAEISPGNYREKLEFIFNSQYKIEKRSVLRADVKKENSKSLSLYAYNDFVVDKGDSLSMIKIKIYIDDEFLNTYRADGLIISTPTGSTAYNLSAGGPIIYPCLEAIVVNPICPHTLTARPLVITDRQKITIKVENLGSTPFLSTDGQIKTPLSRGMEVVIYKADFHLNIIRLPGETFFKTIRAKLNWGKDVRGN